MNRALRSRRRRALAVAAVLLAASQPGPPLTSVDAQGSQGIAAVERRFAAPPDEARIMMRWWWFGPSITRAEIESEMQRMKDGGIGGFEIATVYPMAVDDPARGIRNYAYLSPEFRHNSGSLVTRLL